MRFAAWFVGLATFLFGGLAALAAIDNRYPPITLLVVALTVVGSIVTSAGAVFELARAVSREPLIVIGRPRRLATRIGTTGPVELTWDAYSDAERERRRRVLLFVRNDTDHQQRLVIEPDDSYVVWPRYPSRVLVEYRELALAPHEGGNVDVLIANSALEWPDPAPWPRRLYWIRIRAHTQSGRIVRFFGPARARPLRSVSPDGLTDYLFHVSRLGFVRPN